MCFPRQFQFDSPNVKPIESASVAALLILSEAGNREDSRVFSFGLQENLKLHARQN